MMKPKPLYIWLVRFPFSDLTATKLRPAFILSVHQERRIYYIRYFLQNPH